MAFLTAPFTVVVESERCIFSLSSENPQMLNSWKFAGQTFYKCYLHNDPDTVSADLPPSQPVVGVPTGPIPPPPPLPSVRVFMTMKVSRGNPTTEIRLQKYFHLIYMEKSYCNEKRVPGSGWYTKCTHPDTVQLLNIFMITGPLWVKKDINKKFVF
jgi:hypothetical protein